MRLAIRAAKYQMQLWFLGLLTIGCFLLGFTILFSVALLLQKLSLLDKHFDAVYLYLITFAFISYILAKTWGCSLQVMAEYGLKVTYEETLIHLCFDFAFLGLMVGLA